MKFLHFAIALLFILFAYWQLNDPDWPQWVTIYGFVSVTAVLVACKKLPFWFPWVGIVIVSGWLLALVPDFISWLRMGTPTITGQMQAESPHVELTREFFGLAICLVALGYYAWYSKRMERTRVKGLK